MAECVMVLARKQDEDQEYATKEAYDEAKNTLLGGDELHLGVEGYIYDFEEAGDVDFFDGAKDPGVILDMAKNWVAPYASDIARHIQMIVKDAGENTGADDFIERLTACVMSYQNGHKLYKSVNQMFGYPEFCVEQLFIDEYGCVSVNPGSEMMKDIEANPENYFRLIVTYHG